ncbi:MAG: hypothetical protein QXT73_02360 [Candidatus Methanomethylicaceae archaeon]
MPFWVLQEKPVTIRRYRRHTCFEALGEFLPVIERFALAMEYEVVDLYNPHGEPFIPFEVPPGGCAFVFWSLPGEYFSKGTYRQRTLEQAFGYTLGSGAGDSLQPFDDLTPGFTFVRDADAVLAVLDFTHHIYYITPDLVHKDSGLPVFNVILDHIESEVKPLSATTTSGAEAFEAELQEFARTLASSAASRLRAHIHQMIHKEESSGEEVTKKFRDGLEEEKAAYIKRRFASQELHRVLTLPGVERVVVREDIISIYTYPIIVSDFEKPGSYRVLGRYRIDLSRDFQVRVINLDLSVKLRPRRTHNAIHHPYTVTHDGGICLGNATGIIMDAARRFDLYTFTLLMLRLLRNPQDNSSSFKARLRRYSLVSQTQLLRAYPEIDLETLWPKKSKSVESETDE